MKTGEYEAALRELEQLRQAGRVTQEYYDVTRAKLIAEAAKPPLPLAVRLILAAALIFIGLVVVLPIVTAVLAALG